MPDEDAGQEHEQPQPSKAELRAQLKRELEAELAAEEATSDRELAWELSRREEAALAALRAEDPDADQEDRDAAVLAVRVEWITERRLEAELEAKLEARLAKKQAEQAQRVHAEAVQAYGRGSAVGGTVPFAYRRRQAPPPAETSEQYVSRRISETVGDQLRAGWQPPAGGE